MTLSLLLLLESIDVEHNLASVLEQESSCEKELETDIGCRHMMHTDWAPNSLLHILGCTWCVMVLRFFVKQCEYKRYCKMRTTEVTTRFVG